MRRGDGLRGLCSGAVRPSEVRLQKAAEKLAKVGTAQKSGELLQAAVALRAPPGGALQGQCR